MKTKTLLSLTLLLACASVCQVHAQTNCTPRPAGLIAWWPGDGVALNLAGTNDGILLNGTTYGPGKAGQAFQFDGSDDYISFGNQIGNFSTNDFSIKFWIKTTSTREEVILSKRVTCGHGSFWSIQLSAGTIYTGWDQDSAGNNYVSLPTTNRINNGFFHHAFVVRRATNMLYERV